MQNVLRRDALKPSRSHQRQGLELVAMMVVVLVVVVAVVVVVEVVEKAMIVVVVVVVAVAWYWVFTTFPVFAAKSVRSADHANSISRWGSRSKGIMAFIHR